MGFAPSSATFMKALHEISLTDALTWDQKMEVYKKCGWTEMISHWRLERIPFL